MTTKTEQWLLDHTKGLHVRTDYGNAVYTSMFVRINGNPYLLTAGHCLEALDTARKRKIPIREAMVFPTNGTEAIPFTEYLEDKDTPLYFVNEKDSIDIGLIPLRMWHDSQFKNETFITKTHYSGLPSKYTGCILIGFPSALEEFGTSHINVYPAFVNVARTWRPSDQPKTTPTRFYGRINVGLEFDVKGMSGGPIVGFLHDPAKDELRYWIVALQSGWIRSEKLIFGTRLSTCIPTMLRHFGLDWR